MPDFTKLGSAYTEIRADTSLLHADLMAVRGLLEKQLGAAGTRSFKQLGTAATHAGSQIKKSFKESIASALSFERMVSRLAFIGTVGAVYALGRAIQSVFKNGVDAAKDFENAIAHINTVLDDSAKKYLPIFKREIAELATRLGVDVLDLSKGLYDIISARIPPDNAMAVLAAATESAVANQANLKDVVSAVLTTLNSYSMEASKAAEITDKFQAAIKFGRMEMSEFAPVFGDLAASAAVLGIELDQVLGVIATMTRGGLDPKKTITSVNRAFLKLGESADLSAKMVKDGFLSVIPIIAAMEQQQQKIVTGGVRGFKTFAITFQNLEDAGWDVVEVMNAIGEREKALAIQMEANKTKESIAVQETKQVWRDFGEDFKTVGTDIQHVLRDLSIGLISFLEIVTLKKGIFEQWQELVMSAARSLGVGGLFYKSVEESNTVLLKAGEIWDNIGASVDKAMSGMIDDQKELASQYSTNITNLKALIKEKEREYRISKESGVGEVEKYEELKTLYEALATMLKNRAADFKDSQDFRNEALDAELALWQLINSAIEKGADPIKAANDEFKIRLQYLEDLGVLGEHTHIRTLKAYDDQIAKLKELKASQEEITAVMADRQKYLESRPKARRATLIEPDDVDLIAKFSEEIEHLNNLHELGAVGIGEIIDAYDLYIEKLKEAGATDVQISEAMLQRQRLIEQQYGRLEDAIADMVSIATDLQMEGSEKWKAIWKSFVDNAMKELNRLLAHQVFRFLLGMLFKGLGIASLFSPGGAGAAGAATNLAGGGGTGGILGGGGGMPLMPTINPVINFSPGGGGGNNQILRELVAIRTEIANKPVAHTQVLYPEQVSVVNDLGKNIRSEQGILSD